MKVVRALAVLILMSLVPAYSAPEKQYGVIYLNGIVNPIVSEYIAESVKSAASDRCSYVVLVIDTPGGGMDSMREIIESIHSSDIPVVAYTFPKGARAASAGGFIMLASDVAAMAPGTNIGAMHPVNILPEFLKGDKDSKTNQVMEKKILNDAVAYARSLAQESGRNQEWAENAVKKAVSSSYLEAQRAGVIEIIAEDMDDLTAKLNGRVISFKGKKFTFDTAGITDLQYVMTWKQRAVNRVADPQVLLLLFIIAVAGLWMEIKNPGSEVLHY